MPNIAQIFKEEIARLARKEIRAEVEGLKRTTSNQRAEIAGLKRQLRSLTQEVKRAVKTSGASSSQLEVSGEQNFRYSAKGLASHRKRLALSAEQFGALLGVSGQSIYKWEAGKARPRAAQLQSIAAIRSIGKREAAKRLEALAAS